MLTFMRQSVARKNFLVLPKVWPNVEVKDKIGLKKCLCGLTANRWVVKTNNYIDEREYRNGTHIIFILRAQ